MSLTAHFFNRLSHEIETRVLGLIYCEESQTADAQHKQISDLLSNFFGDVENFTVTAITTDNAAVMKATARLLKMTHVGCFAHSLQLSLKDNLYGKKKGVFVDLVTKVLCFLRLTLEIYDNIDSCENTQKN